MATAAAASLVKCRVVESRPVGPYRLIGFVAEEIAAIAQPGQFVMVRRTGPAFDPLLPRPMGIHDIDADLVKILLEPVGKGTKDLALSQVGDSLNVLGPLGQGFDLSGSGPAVLVGGGIGVSPLTLLAKALKERGRPLRCLLGFRNMAQASAAELFRDLKPEIITEDGSLGRQGLVSEPLDACLAEMGEAGAEVFACGPNPMLAACWRLAQACGVTCQVSVDSHMACGVGACQGCVIKTTAGYRKVCNEGPVFNAEDLIWP